MDITSKSTAHPVIPHIPFEPKRHVLKTLPHCYEATESGAKNFEVRRDDRGFQRGDILVLQKLCKDSPSYIEHAGYGATSKPLQIERRITWILTGGQFGIEPGFVVMGLEPV